MNHHRVFISSTCFDLLDIRAELTGHLRALGATPVLSDDKLSDFAVHPSANSIETCLINVDSCKDVIVILDKRYGPKLGAAGFENISATHLEYKRAKANGTPIHFFVRDRLEAEYSLWKRNKSDRFELCWAQDVELLEFLDEHRRLKGAVSSNWVHSFTSSLDLKECISRRLGREFIMSRVENSVRNNEFPLFEFDMNMSPEPVGGQGKYTINIQNISKTPAFNVSICWEKDVMDPMIHHIFPPGREVNLQFTTRLGLTFQESLTVILEYSTFEGVKVRERHEAKVHSVGYLNIHGIKLLERKFFQSNDKLKLEIEEPD